MLDALLESLSASPWTYLIVLGLVALDGSLPVLPGETSLIAAAILAADGELSIVLVVLAAAAGAWLGDNITYQIGARGGRRAVPKLFRSRRAQESRDWARRQLKRRGAVIIIAARPVPVGRTATTFAAGALAMAWPRFAAADAAAALLWATYGGMLGYLGGETFRDSFWKPLAIGLLFAALISGVAELVRRRRRRR